MRRRMTHLFVGARTCASRTENVGTGVEAGIVAGSSMLDARRKATQQRWVPIETRRWRVKLL